MNQPLTIPRTETSTYESQQELIGHYIQVTIESVFVKFLKLKSHISDRS